MTSYEKEEIRPVAGPCVVQASVRAEGGVGPGCMACGKGQAGTSSCGFLSNAHGVCILP